MMLEEEIDEVVEEDRKVGRLPLQSRRLPEVFCPKSVALVFRQRGQATPWGIQAQLSPIGCSAG